MQFTCLYTILTPLFTLITRHYWLQSGIRTRNLILDLLRLNHLTICKISTKICCVCLKAPWGWRSLAHGVEDRYTSCYTNGANVSFLLLWNLGWLTTLPLTYSGKPTLFTINYLHRSTKSVPSYTCAYYLYKIRRTL